MKIQTQLVTIGFCLLLISCGQPGDSGTASSTSTGTTAEITDSPNASGATTAATEPEVPMPYPASRAADWTIGDKEKIRTVLNMYKHYDENMNYEDVLGSFADSIEFISFDDRHVKYKKEDFVSHVKKMREQYKDIDLAFRTYVCLHSDSLKVDMVTLWINENVTWKNGAKESTAYLETWLFNEQGKIFRAGDYSRFKR